MLALLLAAAAPAPGQASVIDAERAFAAGAKSDGQWTAFRRFADPDAVMFVPEPTPARRFLLARADPAQPLDWWPTAAWMSCDGALAVDTGGYRRPDGKIGYFTTIWKRQPGGGWGWIVDSGDELASPRPRPAAPPLRTAACEGGHSLRIESTATSGYGESPDATLRWRWFVANGERRVIAYLWNGRDYESVLSDRIAVAEK